MQMRKRQPPPTETHAEIYYYKKQIDAHTPMVLVLQDGEEIEGTIEWYDRGALKINRRSAPNLLVLDIRMPGMSGLGQIADRLSALDDIAVVRLEDRDIVRHPLVAAMLTVL